MKWKFIIITLLIISSILVYSGSPKIKSKVTSFFQQQTISIPQPRGINIEEVVKNPKAFEGNYTLMHGRLVNKVFFDAIESDDGYYMEVDRQTCTQVPKGYPQIKRDNLYVFEGLVKQQYGGDYRLYCYTILS